MRAWGKVTPRRVLLYLANGYFWRWGMHRSGELEKPVFIRYKREMSDKISILNFTCILSKKLNILDYLMSSLAIL